MTETTAGGAGPAAYARHAGGDGPAPARRARRRRMWAEREPGAVLRLLRGEDLELAGVKGARGDGGVTAAELSARREGVLAAGEASLKARPAGGRAVEIGRLRAEVGDLTMANELPATKIEHLEAGRPLARRRSRRWAARSRPPRPDPTAFCG